MPMNPEKFKQIITDHFKTVTPEEFLENLRKSSPYLFTENLEAKKNIYFADTSALNSNSGHSIIDRQNTEETKIDRG
jgi:hypothetical protein